MYSLEFFDGIRDSLGFYLSRTGRSNSVLCRLDPNILYHLPSLSLSLPNEVNCDYESPPGAP